MIGVDIPGFGQLRIEHLVLDFNGTIAVDGKLIPKLKTRLGALVQHLSLHVLTADTFGTVRREMRTEPCSLVPLSKREQDHAKAAYVRRLGSSRTACIGNGRNDRLMLRTASLSIAVVQAEGAAPATLAAADIVVNDVRDALDLFLKPQRLIATLRR